MAKSQEQPKEEEKEATNYEPPKPEEGSAEAFADREREEAAAEREALEAEDKKPKKSAKAKDDDDKTAEVEASSEEDKPAYTPNYKFKHGKLDEKESVEAEFEEWVRPFIKDEDTEKKFRDLFSQAYGAEHLMKPRHEKVVQERDMHAQNFNQLVQEVRDITALRDQDLGMFLEKCGIPIPKIARYLADLADRENLPPEQKAAYTEFDNLKRENLELKRKFQGMEHSVVDSGIQARTQELQSVLTSPEVAPIAKDFDSRLGRVGSFEDFVMRHGRAEWELSGGKRDLNAREAVNEVVKILGLQIQPQGQGGMPNGSAETKPKVVQPPKATVIPNVGSGSGSSTMKRPKSVDDLRKQIKEMGIV